MRLRKQHNSWAALVKAFGTLAGTTADIGRVGSELGRADLGMLTQLGDIGRNFQQQQLEAQRQTNFSNHKSHLRAYNLVSSFLKDCLARFIFYV